MAPRQEARKPALTTVPGAMRRLKVPAGTVRALILQGRLRVGSYDVMGGATAVYSEDLDALVASLPERVRPPKVESFSFPGSDDWDV